MSKTPPPKNYDAINYFFYHYARSVGQTLPDTSKIKISETLWAKPGAFYLDSIEINVNRIYLDPANIKEINVHRDAGSRICSGCGPRPATFIARNNKEPLIPISNFKIESSKQDTIHYKYIIDGKFIEDTTGIRFELSCIEKIEILKNSTGIHDHRNDPSRVTILIRTKLNEKESVRKNLNWSDNTKLSIEEKEQKRIWDEFKTAVLSKDIDSFKKLSGNCVYLYDTCITIEKFVKEDFHNIFHEKANEFYFKDKNIGWISATEHSDSIKIDCIGGEKEMKYQKMEVSISNKSCRGEECSQAIFTFINDGKCFRFYSIINFP